MEPVFVVGIGPGSRAYLLPAAAEAIENADVLVGARRHLDEFVPPAEDGEGTDEKETIVIQNSFADCLDEIDRKRRSGRVAVLVSGDPCLFSYLALLLKRFPRKELRIVPGISSLQLLAARAGLLLNNAVLVSVHGRPLGEIGEAFRNNRKIALLTDHEHTPPVIARYLLDLNKSAECGEGVNGRPGESGVNVVVGKNLSYPDESIEETTLEALACGDDDGKTLCVMILERSEKHFTE